MATLFWQDPTEKTVICQGWDFVRVLRERFESEDEIECFDA